MPRVKQFDEQEVLEKSMELFWKHGYNDTSIGDLVKHLGVNRASLYGVFKNKDDLFFKALAHYRKVNFAAIESHFEGFKDLPVKEQISQLFQSAIEDSMNDNERKGCFVVNTLVELAPHNELVKEKGLENQNTFVNFFSLILEAGKEKGELANDLDVKAAAEYLYTLYSGLKVSAKVKPDRQTMESIVNIAMKVLG